MTARAPIVDEFFDMANTSEKLRARIYAPLPFQRTTYACRVRLGPPFDRDRPSYGEGALQALAIGVEVIAANLYSSQAWREGRLGWRGEFGGYLGLPAPTSYLDFAPYHFDLTDADERPAVEADEGSEGTKMILEETFAVFDPLHPVGVRIFQPERMEDGRWRCRVQIDDPIAVDRYALGDGGLEALWRALCLIARELYGHPLWRAAKLGAIDDPGGYLRLPAPTSLLYLAPHAF